MCRIRTRFMGARKLVIFCLCLLSVSRIWFLSFWLGGLHRMKYSHLTPWSTFSNSNLQIKVKKEKAIYQIFCCTSLSLQDSFSKFRFWHHLPRSGFEKDSDFFQFFENSDFFFLFSSCWLMRDHIAGDLPGIPTQLRHHSQVRCQGLFRPQWVPCTPIANSASTQSQRPV